MTREGNLRRVLVKHSKHSVQQPRRFGFKVSLRYQCVIRRHQCEGYVEWITVL